jgi:hypothetical protein
VQEIEIALKRERVESVARSFPENACGFAALEFRACLEARAARPARVGAGKIILP